MLLFLCVFLWERNLLSLSLTQVEASVHPESIGLGLGEERSGNISSKPPTSVDSGLRTTEDMIF